MNSDSAPKALKVDDGTKEETPKTGEDEVFEVSPFNLVVTGNIAKFADFATLKAMRRVDKIWSEGATPQLRKRSVVNLQTEGKLENELNLENFIETTEKLQPIKNIMIKVSRRDPGPGRQQVEKLFNSILRFVAPDLEHLIINDGFSPNPTIPFPNLVKLVLSEYGMKTNSNYRELYQNCQNLVELEVDTWAGDLRGDVVLFPLLNSDGSRNTALLPKLSSFNSTFPEDIKFLATFPQTWSKLELKCSTKMIPHLKELLEKNKGTLISLTLRGFSDVNFTEVVKLNFPDCFPRLQKLDMRFFPFNYPTKFKVSFGGKEELNYSKTFPALKTLNLCIKKLRRADLEILWRTFFAKQVCTTLNFLKIYLKPIYPDFLPWAEDEFWYKQQFPNIRVKNIKTCLDSEYSLFYN